MLEAQRQGRQHLSNKGKFQLKAGAFQGESFFKKTKQKTPSTRQSSSRPPLIYTCLRHTSLSSTELSLHGNTPHVEACQPNPRQAPSSPSYWVKQSGTGPLQLSRNGFQRQGDSRKERGRQARHLWHQCQGLLPSLHRGHGELSEIVHGRYRHGHTMEGSQAPNRNNEGIKYEGQCPQHGEALSECTAYTMTNIPTSLSICPFACLPVCHSIIPSICPSIHPGRERKRKEENTGQHIGRLAGVQRGCTCVFLLYI